MGLLFAGLSAAVLFGKVNRVQSHANIMFGNVSIVNNVLDESFFVYVRVLGLFRRVHPLVLFLHTILRDPCALFILVFVVRPWRRAAYDHHSQDAASLLEKVRLHLTHTSSIVKYSCDQRHD